MVAQTNPPVILTASPDDIAFDRDPGSSYSDELTLVGTATPNSTITVYDGSTVLGTTTTNSAGVWSYATSSLTDGTHSFTSTATIAGVTSAASAAVVQNVVGEITNFSPLTDQWSAPISVGGMPYYVENANINGNAPWAITQVDSHTLQFQVRPDDVWADNDSHRSEISGGTIFSAKSTINLSFQLTVQPGFNDTSNGLAWQILGQFHADDNDPTYQTISGGSPPLAFHLTGANGYGEGDYLAIQAFYALPGQAAWTAATTPGDTLNGYLWVSQTPIVRGQPIDIQLEVNFQNNSSGFLEVWINGQQVVDYHGALGYGGGVYWKEGIYEGWSSNQTITVDYANTVITSAPGAPLILGNVVNGNQVMLKGTAQANSAISIYDGATKLGTVTTSSNGSWFYETSALSVGGHNLTATATDSAGNVGAASTAASATISAFTGPMITSVVTSAPTGETVTGTTITFTLKMSSAVSVTGTPTLSLNDGGTAVYKSGSGTNSLTFTYTVGANDSSTKGLGITGANLPSGASITDSGGNAAILTGASVQFPGVTIDTQPVKTPVFGDPVDNGNGTFTFTGTAGANTTVYFSTPYGTTLGNTSVDSTGHWTFTTPTLAGNTWNSIQAYDVNSLGDISSIGSENGIGFGNDSNLPPSPTITGNALVGNVATLYGAVTAGYSITTVAIFDGTTQIGTATVNSDNTWSFSTAALANGVHSFSAESKSSTGTSSGSVPDSITVGTVATAVDAIAPTVSSVAASGTGITGGTGTLNAGNVVTLTVNLSEAVTVAGGTPTLTLNDGGVATYAGGSGTSALTFSYTVGAGQNTADLAVTAVNLNAATVKDSAGNAANLAGAVTNPSGTLQIDTTAPVISTISETPSTGALNAGKIVAYTITMSEVVTVNTTGGTPTLSLNDGGIATYVGGSGTSALTFSYTVLAGQNTPDLMVSAFNLNGAGVADGAGNSADLSLTGIAQGSPSIDTMAPTVSSVAASGTGITSGSGILNAGDVVTLTLNLSEAVTVAGGTPTLTLNDGGVATYAGGSGTNALTFSYTVGAGQNTADLAVTAVNLNSATVKDTAGNTANLAGAVTNPSGTLQIDTTAPTVASLVASGGGITAGNPVAGSVVTMTMKFTEAVTVAGGTPTLALTNGGAATYTGGSGTDTLTFSYTVGAGQDTSSLVVASVNLNSATVKDSAGNNASLAMTPVAGGGPAAGGGSSQPIDNTAPTVASMVASGSGITSGSGKLNTGKVVTLTVNLSEAVTVAGGTPTLTLNDGGVATYAGGSGTSALTFSYTVGVGQNTSDLAVTAVNLNAATVKDSAGNAANLAGAVTNPSGTLQIDTTAPTISSVVASGSGIAAGSGVLAFGGAVTLTVNFSEAVTVASGTPTLTLNDGGVATYTGGSGTNVLTFSYTVGVGQNTSDLAVKAVNLNSATVTDSSGNAANLTGAVTNPSGTLQIDTKIKLTAAGDNYLLLDSTRTGPSLKYEGVSLSIANDFTWYKPIAAVRTATGYDVALKANGSSQYMIASVDANGNWTANLTSIVSGTSSTLQSYESIFHADLNGDGVIVLSGSGTKISSGSLVVGSGATVEIPGAYSGTVSFAGATGTLIIDDSTKFAGSFSGQLARGDIIDLTDVAGGANASLSYSGNASRGTLTVSDGTHSAKLAVVGNYSLGNFVASSDGNGGTSIVDPPLSGSTSVGAPSEGTAAWLASVDQRLALWSQHVASAFPTSSVIDSGGFHTNGSDLGGQNSQLTMPVQRPQSNHTWG